MYNKFITMSILISCCLIAFIACDSKESRTTRKYQFHSKEGQSEPVDHFFFVGRKGNKASLFKYDLFLKKYEETWEADDETVILLSYSDNKEYIFFLTTNKFGTKQGIAFIRGIKLYRIDVENSNIEFITDIGDAVQLFAKWVDMNLKIQFTRFDLKIASHINKINQIYSPFGKLLKEEVETYDFIQEGYPQFEILKSSLISPSGNFGIKQNSDSVYLRFAGSEQLVYIDSTVNKIDKIQWSNDERFVFFTTKSINSDGILYSDIRAYDIVNQLMIIKNSSGGKKDFIVIDNFLAYDDYYGKQQSIRIFNFRENREIDRVNIKGGCGLKYVPG